MKILRSVAEFQEWRKQQGNQSVGFVPTMGALHAGHAALLAKARPENEVLVLSIFVNPTQFNQTQDYEKYPQTWEADLKIASTSHVDAVFAPLHASELYPDDYNYRVSESPFSKTLCGAFRPGHFEGMLTVILKLFMITQPTRAYFGEKDFQQLSLVRGMKDAFFLPLQIVACPTVREASGLALSSRNKRLSPAELEKAPLIYKVLQTAANQQDAKRVLERAGFKFEYWEELAEPGGVRVLLAAWLGEIRLIDNFLRKSGHEHP